MSLDQTVDLLCVPHFCIAKLCHYSEQALILQHHVHHHKLVHWLLWELYNVFLSSARCTDRLQTEFQRPSVINLFANNSAHSGNKWISVVTIRLDNLLSMQKLMTKNLHFMRFIFLHVFYKKLEAMNDLSLNNITLIVSHCAVLSHACSSLLLSSCLRFYCNF